MRLTNPIRLAKYFFWSSKPSPFETSHHTTRELPRWPKAWPGLSRFMAIHDQPNDNFGTL